MNHLERRTTWNDIWGILGTQAELDTTTPPPPKEGDGAEPGRGLAPQARFFESYIFFQRNLPRVKIIRYLF